MNQELDELFETGPLVRPDADVPNMVDLIHALTRLAGVHDGPTGANVIDLGARIGQAEHLVFVLIDGLGMNLLECLPEEAFLRTHLAMTLHAIFPSATACAMTTLATGLWPAQHGVPGWWAYLPERDLSVTCLPFIERFTSTALTGHGMKPTHLFPDAAPLLSRLTRNACLVQPRAIADSDFSDYLRGRAHVAGYDSIHHAVDLVREHVADATGPTYTMLYMDEVDVDQHRYGVHHRATRQNLMKIDRQMARLAHELTPRGGRVVVSADHGQMTNRIADRQAIYGFDPILKLLRAPPSGEPRVPVFHVKHESRRPFKEMFSDRWGKRFVLVSIADADAMRLLGPHPLSDVARARFGDYLAIPRGNATLKFYTRGATPGNDHVGYHAGLSPEEIRVPLILA